MPAKKRARGVAKELVLGPQNAVIYTRVSDTTEEYNESSHEYQEAACRKRAEELGYTVIEVFRDNFSGRYLHERPGLHRLRELVRAGSVHAVFAWKLDRFSRKLAQRAIIVQELREHGCLHVSATEDISDTPEGRLLEAVLGAIAEFEVERTLERSQAVLSLLRDRGSIICQGLARYGYRYVKETRTREIVEDEAKWVRRIFDWYIGGSGSDAIAERLTALGVPTPAQARNVRRKEPAERRWYSSTVRAILKDASFAGAPMVSGKKRSTNKIDRSGNAICEKTAESDWWESEGPTPAIVSRDDYDRAQVMLKEKRAHSASRNTKRPYLLRGMMKCGVCGMTMSPMKTTTRAKQTYYYFSCISTQLKRRCGNKPTPIKWLDERVWDEVVRFMEDEGAIEKRFRELAEINQVDSLDRDLLSHKAAVAKAREGMKRLVLRMETTDDPDLLGPIEERIAELKATIVAHQSEANGLESKLRIFDNQEAAIRRAKEACVRGRERLRDGATFEEKRNLLLALDVQVVAIKKHLTIRIGLPLDGGDGPPTTPFVNGDDSPGGARCYHKQWLLFEIIVAALDRAGIEPASTGV